MTDYTIVTARDAEFEALSKQVHTGGGPVCLDYDAAVQRWWPLLDETFPEHQFCLLDEASGQPVAIGNSLPLAFSGVLSELPDEGLDWVLEQGFLDREAGRQPTLMSALYIEVAEAQRGQGVSAQALSVMRQIGRQKGFQQLIAPVRPSLKERYPLIPMEEYLRWQTAEGLPFDPWLRVHVRAGGKILGVCQRAMSVSGTAAQWAEWTGMAFPSDGSYVIPHGLVPVDVRGELGEYVEPGVWVLHELER